MMNEAEENISLENSTISDVYTQENINYYYRNKNRIDSRLRQLDNEWDIERIFELHDAVNVTAGVMLSGITGNKKWLLLPLAIAIVQYVQVTKGVRLGAALLRKYGFRSGSEIDKERYALKVLRGDFHNVIEVPNVIWEAVNK